MILIEQIRTDHIQARRDRDSVIANLLGVIVGDCEKASKTGHGQSLTDADVIGIVQAIRKRNRDTDALLQTQPDRAAQRASLQREYDAMTKYIPVQLSRDEIQTLAIAQRGTEASLPVGQFMGYLKQHHAGQYDPRDAAAAVKELNAGQS
jgi:uncharacterized protein YqeY